MADDKRSIEDKTDAEQRKHGRKPGLTDADREARNAELIRDKLRGQSWAYLADKYGLRPRACMKIYSDWREQNRSTYQGRDPIAIVHSMLDRLESWVEQLAEVADTTTTEATEIAAINAQMTALTRTAELMQATGILPHDLGTLRLELDVQSLAVRLVSILTEQGATPEMKRAILDALRTEPQMSNGAS